jgi:hypothetical protein
MKKVILIIILLIIILGVIGTIAYFNKTENIQNKNNLEQERTEDNINNVIENSSNANDSQNLQNEGEEVSMENARIKLTVNENEIFVRLDDNQASRDFLEMLPLTLTFEDFNNTEKIATLPNKLSTEDLPSGYTPQVGDFSYYAPWGNISVFYKDFRYSNSLYKLGTIEAGTEILGNLNNDFEVTIERVN